MLDLRPTLDGRAAPPRWVRRLGWLLSGALLVSAPSMGQERDEFFQKCYGSGPPAQVLAACSFVISRGRVDAADLATAYKNRGNAHDDQGEYQQAIEDFDRAIATNPLDADAFNSRGTTRTALRQYEAAVRDFDESIRLNPDSALAYSNRCFARAMLGDRAAALADCDAALQVDARSPAAFASRGFVNLLLKRYDRAAEDFGAELRRRPEDAFALYGRAVARYRSGDLKGADDDVVQATSLKPDIVDDMARLGIVLAGE